MEASPGTAEGTADGSCPAAGGTSTSSVVGMHQRAPSSRRTGDHPCKPSRRGQRARGRQPRPPGGRTGSGPATRPRPGPRCQERRGLGSLGCLCTLRDQRPRSNGSEAHDAQRITGSWKPLCYSDTLGCQRVQGQLLIREFREHGEGDGFNFEKYQPVSVKEQNSFEQTILVHLGAQSASDLDSARSQSRTRFHRLLGASNIYCW